MSLSTPYYDEDGITIHVRDCLEVMAAMKPNSLDAIVTDPPYGLEFMGNAWDAPWKYGFSEYGMKDSHGRRAGPQFTSSRNPMCRICHKHKRGSKRHIACSCIQPDFDDIEHRLSDLSTMQDWHFRWTVEALRVAKPGAYLLAFGGTRTYHRLTCAIEDAGWEIRDCLMWVFGSGFPKSLSVAKATYKMIESRYGTTQCNCLDEGNGCAVRQRAGRSNRETVRIQRHSSESSTEDSQHSIVSSGDRGIDTTAVRELQQDNNSQTTRHKEVKETVLLKELCERGTEKARFRDVEIRTRLEEHADEDSQARQKMSSVSKDAETKRQRASRSSSKTIQNRRNKQPDELSRVVQFLPSSDRSGDEQRDRLDCNRDHTRQVIADDFNGQQTAMARICSWCGKPDREWIKSLEPLGTSLKPAYEPIIVARKPLDGTVAANVLKWGTGAMNIDGCRVGWNGDVPEIGTPAWGGPSKKLTVVPGQKGDTVERTEPNMLGRWPANLIHDGSEEVLAAFPDAPGQIADAKIDPQGRNTQNIYGAMKRGHEASANSDNEGEVGFKMRPGARRLDIGSAARFFYTAKASASDRGHEEWDALPLFEEPAGQFKNTHPTVKPLALMRYLLTLVSREGSVVYDPFMGSGSTLVAGKQLGRQMIGSDVDATYAEIAVRRLAQTVLPL